MYYCENEIFKKENLLKRTMIAASGQQVERYITAFRNYMQFIVTIVTKLNLIRTFSKSKDFFRSFGPWMISFPNELNEHSASHLFLDNFISSKFVQFYLKSIYILR